MVKWEPSDLQPLTLEDVQLWKRVYWAELERRIGPFFARSEARVRALTYIGGLLSPAERKTSWQLAELNGDPNPYAFQHLLGRANWNADDLRDALRTYIVDHLADQDAIGVIDETGFLKKGIHSAGVARQYSGTAGKIENCQIGVFLAYASSLGHTLLDRELYLPKEWTDDRARCRTVGIPDERAFATKPELARQMLERVSEAGVTLAYITGDSIYGDDRALRGWLEERKQAYVLAVSGKEHVWRHNRQHQIKTLVAELPNDGWEQHSAGAGSKGPRLYQWRCLELSTPAPQGFKRLLLIRRSMSEPFEMTGYVAFVHESTSIEELVHVAGMRWTIEESIQCAKGEVGLDHYEVRSWTGWYRHMTLVLWASAFLSVLRTEVCAESAPKKGLLKRPEHTSLRAFRASRGLPSG